MPKKTSERAPGRAVRRTTWIPVIAGVVLVAGTGIWLSRMPAAKPTPAPSPAANRADSRSPAKRQMARTLLEGPSFSVHLDPRRPGVLLPEHLTKQPSLVIQLGKEVETPIPDLDLGEKAILASLSFGGKPFPCVIPWTAVFALVGPDRKGKVWDKDVPPEVLPDLLAKMAEPDGGMRR